MAELKPCPFCGGEVYFSGWSKGWSVECHNIYCDILPQTHICQSQKEAAEEWNRRAGDTK